MDRRAPILAAALVALLASGACQDYNFNPVGHCVIQPGTRRVTLSNVSTADVLFVVDDSGSMASEQASLGANFSQFLDVLIDANQARAANPPLQPIDFHIAVTSTSVFYNPEIEQNGAVGSECSDVCPGAPGSKVCCVKTSAGPAVPQAPLCGSDAECAAGYECRADCLGSNYLGSTACCTAAVPHTPQRIACSTLGEACGDLDQYYYYDPGCDPSYVGPASFLLRNVHYPQGAFMAPSANPKVLHFGKDLNWAGGASDPAISSIANDFIENVVVGTCGSPEEQGLEAARLAVQKALAGSQSVPRCPPDWTPDSTLDCWPHPNSKLVVVWVTDENDASSPISAASGVVAMSAANNTPEEIARKYDISRYADYFTSLGRPFGAAFIAGATALSCEDSDCIAARCCTEPGAIDACNGSETAPERYFELARELRDRKLDVVVGSICSPFGSTLGRIGEIVKPPPGLELPTLPAATEVTVLRITKADGTTRKTCSRPAPPTTVVISEPVDESDPLDPSNVAAQAYIDGIKNTYDWWFTDNPDQAAAYQRLPRAASQNVYINHARGECEANPGETYSLDYIGRLPQAGCASDQACADTLGGLTEWTCFGGVDLAGNCVKGTASLPGTCLCGSPASNQCPPDP